MRRLPRNMRRSRAQHSPGPSGASVRRQSSSHRREVIGWPTAETWEVWDALGLMQQTGAIG
jgi:hypothetical protein